MDIHVQVSSDERRSFAPSLAQSLIVSELTSLAEEIFSALQTLNMENTHVTVYAYGKDKGGRKLLQGASPLCVAGNSYRTVTDVSVPGRPYCVSNMGREQDRKSCSWFWSSALNNSSSILCQGFRSLCPL